MKLYLLMKHSNFLHVLDTTLREWYTIQYFGSADDQTTSSVNGNVTVPGGGGGT